MTLDAYHQHGIWMYLWGLVNGAVVSRLWKDRR
jgi:hypothetical protein